MVQEKTQMLRWWWFCVLEWHSWYLVTLFAYRRCVTLIVNSVSGQGGITLNPWLHATKVSVHGTKKCTSGVNSNAWSMNGSMLILNYKSNTAVAVYFFSLLLFQCLFHHNGTNNLNYWKWIHQDCSSCQLKVLDLIRSLIPQVSFKHMDILVPEV